MAKQLKIFMGCISHLTSMSPMTPVPPTGLVLIIENKTKGKTTTKHTSGKENLSRSLAEHLKEKYKNVAARMQVIYQWL